MRWAGKHVVDTDLYVRFIRTGEHHELLADLYGNETPGIYFSSVVLEELLAGVVDARGLAAVARLHRPFERVGRILTPTHVVWKEAGEFLAWARRAHPPARSKVPRLTNDALIALSARTLGATVHTTNAQDFELIARFRPVSLRLEA